MIGEILPLALGVAVSPVPVIASVLMLTTPLSRAKGPSFLLGWLLGLGALGAIVLLVAGPTDLAADGGLSTWVSWVELVAAMLLLVVAVRQFRSRPRRGDDAPLPRWMDAAEGIRPLTALGLGGLLATVNPKNVLLVVAAGVAIAGTDAPGRQQALAYAVFALIGSIGVAVPLAIYLAGGEQAPKTLARLKDWLALHNKAIVSVLCLVISAKLVGDAVPVLTG